MASFKSCEVIGGSLNLRASASTTSTRLAGIPNGTKLDVSDHDSTWLSTTYNGQSGYVMRAYVDMSTASPRNQSDLFGSSNLVYAPSTVNKYVFNLQHFLNKWIAHIPASQIAVDGKFGPATKSLVESFQYQYDRNNVDGIVGPDTKYYLCLHV